MKTYRIDCRCCGIYYNSMYIGSNWDITDRVYYICKSCSESKKIKEKVVIRIFKKIKLYWRSLYHDK